MMGDEEIFVKVSYQIEVADDIHTLTCNISRSDNAPYWLQLYKFVLKSVLKNGKYTQLYAHHENVKNVDTMLFIDKVYKDIMDKEHCTMATV